MPGAPTLRRPASLTSCVASAESHTELGYLHTRAGQAGGGAKSGFRKDHTDQPFLLPICPPTERAISLAGSWAIDSRFHVLLASRWLHSAS
jgi:hypothetical protein